MALTEIGMPVWTLFANALNTWRYSARAAAEVNRSVENVGARRLYNVIERVFEEGSFVGPDQPGTEIVIDKAYLNKHLDALL